MNSSWDIFPNIRDFIIRDNVKLMIKAAEEIGTSLGILNAHHVLSIYRVVKSNLNQVIMESNSRLILNRLHLLKPKIANIIARSGSRGRPGLETLYRILIAGLDIITEVDGDESYKRTKNFDAFLEAIISFFQYAQKGGAKYGDELEVKTLQDRILNLQSQLDKLSQFISVSTENAKVFLSHAHDDKPFVEKLQKELEKENIFTWYDNKDMEIGDIVSDAILEGIKQSWCFLIVISPKSIESIWVKKEIDWAYDDHIKEGKRIFPVLTGNISDAQIPNRLQTHLYADFRKESDYEESLKKLIRAIVKEGSKKLKI